MPSGSFFEDFAQVSDEEVVAILQPKASKVAATG
jgi:predicted phosphoribosyltransferase